MIASRLKAVPTHWANWKTWHMELLFAVPIVAFVIYLYYTWFAVRDRYLIFLYFHDLGSSFDTTPFGWVTTGRYWMTGLVAGGAVMIPYIAANFVLGRSVKSYRPPVWWRLWLLCAIPLLIAIPTIVMTVNHPVLPFRNTAQVTAVLLIGLALAVGLGQYAATYPAGYILLLIDGIAPACLLMSLRAAESYQHWLARGNTAAILRFLAVLAVGMVLLIVTTAIYYGWRRTRIPDAVSWLAAGVNIHYLFLPIYHHLFWCKDGGSWTDPDYFSYIPSAGNYFSGNIFYQFGVWVGVALVVMGVTQLRSRLRQ